MVTSRFLAGPEAGISHNASQIHANRSVVDFNSFHLTTESNSVIVSKIDKCIHCTDSFISVV